MLETRLRDTTNRGLSEGQAEDLFIRLNGKTTTTATIPFSEGIFIPDNKSIILGTGSDATIKYDGTNVVVNPKAVGGGAVLFDTDSRLYFRSSSVSIYSPETDVIRYDVLGLAARHEWTLGATEIMGIRSTGVRVSDKLSFTQTDDLEYIDSEADGELDVAATTSVDFKINGTEQITLIDGGLNPTTSNDIDLGTSSVLYKDIYTASGLRLPLPGTGSQSWFGRVLNIGDSGIRFDRDTESIQFTRAGTVAFQVDLSTSVTQGEIVAYHHINPDADGTNDLGTLDGTTKERFRRIHLYDVWARHDFTSIGDEPWGMSGVVPGQLNHNVGEQGGIWQLQTNTTDNNSVSANTRNFATVAKNYIVNARLKISSTSSIDAKFGFSIGSFASGMYFWYDTDTSHTSWHAITADSDSSEDDDTGIAPDTNYHDFRIEISTTRIDYYIDDVLVATSTDTNDIETGVLQVRWSVTTRTTSNRSSRMDLVEWWGDR